MVTRRKTYVQETAPYHNNPEVSLVYEINFKNDVIKPGSLIKIKHERSVFRFRFLAVNSHTGKEWVDVYDTTLGGWRAFRPDKIMGIVYKRSFAKTKK